MEKVGNNSLLPLRKGETNINLHILQWKYQYPPPSEGGQRGMKKMKAKTLLKKG